jgi:hypothetical protein
MMSDAAGRVGLDEVDGLPWDVARRDALQPGGERTSRHHSLEQAADGAARARIDKGNAQVQAEGRSRVAVEGQLDIVNADHLAAVHVDDLLVEQVALQQQHALAAGILGQIGGVGRGVHAAVDGAEQVAAYDAVSLRGADDEGGDVGGVVLGHQRDFAHAPHAAGIRVIDGQAQQLR